MENCTIEADNFIKDLIYKTKVVLFGTEDCEYTKKAEEHFAKNYKHHPVKISLDNIDYSQMKFSKKNLVECLKKRTKTNVVPIVYINGMYIGNYKSLEEKTFLKDLEIFF